MSDTSVTLEFREVFDALRQDLAFMVGRVHGLAGHTEDVLRCAQCDAGTNALLRRASDFAIRAPATAHAEPDGVLLATREIVPACLSRTCFAHDCSWDHCWGCEDSEKERQRVAAIIQRYCQGSAAKDHALVACGEFFRDEIQFGNLTPRLSDRFQYLRDLVFDVLGDPSMAEIDAIKERYSQG